MNRLFKPLLIALLLLAVAVVFFAPSVDLEPTALRASQAAQALQMAIVSAALVFSALVSFVGFSFRRSLESGLAVDSDLLVLNCTRLC